MRAWLDYETLHIELATLQPPRPSKSGKTTLVASTGRCTRSDIIIDGKPLYLLVNAFVFGEVSEADDLEKNQKNR